MKQFGDKVKRSFKALRITCNGTLTNIVIGAKRNDQQKDLPIVQLTTHRTLNQQNFYLSSQNASFIDNTLFEYNLSSSSVQVQEGDFLAIFQPQRSKSNLILYYQQFNGPRNYDSNCSIIANKNDYPLVSISVGKYSIDLKQISLILYSS